MRSERSRGSDKQTGPKARAERPRKKKVVQGNYSTQAPRWGKKFRIRTKDCLSSEPHKCGSRTNWPRNKRIVCQASTASRGRGCVYTPGNRQSTGKEEETKKKKSSFTRHFVLERENASRLIFGNKREEGLGIVKLFPSTSRHRKCKESRKGRFWASCQSHGGDMTCPSLEKIKARQPE